MENTKKTQVSKQIWKEMLMDQNERIEEMSNGCIHVFEKDGKAGINWSSIGTQTTEEAEKFAATLLKAVGIIENFNSLIEVVKSEAKPAEKPVEKKEAKGVSEKEEKVLRAIIAESNFNMCKVDLSKSWDEQVFESEYFEAFADTKDYGCGLSKGAARGVFGSLSKKGLIDLAEGEGGDGKPFTWIIIREEEFNKIKKVLG